MFDFPSSPANGAASNGYVFNGVGWVVAPALVAVSDTPPASPLNNSLWWESDSAGLYLRMNDGSSSQWVQVNTPGIQAPPQDGKGYVMRNGVWVPETGVIQKVAANVYAGVTIAGSIYSTGAITEGTEITFANITVKNPASTLIVRATMSAAISNQVYHAFSAVYTNLGTSALGMVGVTGNAGSTVYQNLSCAGAVVHGQPAGTIIRCSLRGIKGNAGLVSMTAPAGGSLLFEVEEVM